MTPGRGAVRRKRPIHQLKENRMAGMPIKAIPFCPTCTSPFRMRVGR